jgi:hypothetical protein
LLVVLVPILEFQHAPLIPEVLQAGDRIPTSLSSVVFTFGLTFESYKQLEGASNDGSDLDPNTSFLMFTFIQLKNM